MSTSFTLNELEAINEDAMIDHPNTTEDSQSVLTPPSQLCEEAIKCDPGLYGPLFGDDWSMLLNQDSSLYDPVFGDDWAS